MKNSGAEELSKWLETAKEKLRLECSRVVCVVGVVGQSEAGSSKAELLNAAFTRQAFLGRLSVPKSPARIYAYYDSQSQSILLCLESHQDFHNAANSLSDFQGDAYEWLSEEEREWGKALLLLSHLCTILVIHSPAARLELSWIRVLRSLNSMREDLGGLVGGILGTVSGVSGEWQRNGRPSAPRLLFTFARAPVRPDLAHHKRSELLQKLEASLEMQLFTLLRKSRVILNNSAQAFGAVPSKAEFVHVIGPGESAVDTPTQLLALLHSVCPLGSGHGPSPTPLLSLDDDRHSGEGAGFHRFLMSHVDAAFQDGFQDNVGKNVPPAQFELPKMGVWLEVAAALHQFFLLDPLPPESLAALTKKLDIELEYSRSRCAKSYPVALRTYKDGLPDFYPKHQHEAKLCLALGQLRAQSRGPCLAQTEAKLEAEAEGHWKDGRLGCERRSLTANYCTHPLHKDPENGGKRHESSARYLSTCNCGANQALRDDPFTLKEANLYFYQSINFMCCQRKEAFDFPLRSFPKQSRTEKEAESVAAVFQKLGIVEHSDTSTPPVETCSGGGDYMERDNRPLSGTNPKSHSQDRTHSDSQDKAAQETSQEERGEDVSSLLDPDEDEASSQEGLSDLSDDRANRGAGERGEDAEDPDQTLLPLDDPPTIVEKEERPRVVRTEEELIWDEWMPFTAASSELLPTFPSWSLICHGSSALYQHSIGLRDQPNYSHGANFLLPWDVQLKVDVEKWTTALDSMATGSSSFALQRKAAKIPKKGGEVSVRLFLGLEYECPRGHRFHLAAPDRILKHPKEAPAGPKDSAAWITKSDSIPVWFPCACRSTPPLTAQLMRLHLVTPKAPVTVNLSVRVQPDTRDSTVFHPGTPPPAIPLNPAKYYVLRFPYSYVGPKGPVYPPKDPVIAGKLLKGVLSVVPDLTL